MAEIDLTFIELANANYEQRMDKAKRATEAKVKDKKVIQPQFTEGVQEYYENLGKNLPKQELSTMLSTIKVDYLFDELRRRFEGLNSVIEGVTAVVLNTEPVDVSPARIEALRADFKRAEELKEELKKIINA